MGIVLMVVLALVLVVTLVVLAARRWREPDAVSTFQRQIDALSPEARRPVVDQLQRLEQVDDQPGEAEDPGPSVTGDEIDPSDPSDSPDPSDEEPPRGA